MTGEGGRSVLVVSADEVCLLLLGRLVESTEGLSLSGSATETNAVSEARRTRPDLIVLDADPSGAEASAGLLGKLSLVSEATLVALSCSAWPGTAETEGLLEAGADVVFPKPSGRGLLSLAGAEGVSYGERLVQIGLRRPIEGGR